jgi:hypothetical protein
MILNCALELPDHYALVQRALFGTTGWSLERRERADSEKTYTRERWPEDGSSSSACAAPNQRRLSG